MWRTGQPRGRSVRVKKSGPYFTPGHGGDPVVHQGDPPGRPYRARPRNGVDEYGASNRSRMSGWKLHPLERDLAGHWSVWVNGNWRMTFTFEGENAVLVDYQDDH